jgi:hypothetical protein
MADVTAIATAVAGLVHVDPADPDVNRAVFAAIEFVVTAENIDLAGGTAADALPSDELTTHGLIGFSRALYLDVLASRGSTVAVGDSVVDTVYTPEDPYRHWRHYFAPLAEAWGYA